MLKYLLLAGASLLACATAAQAEVTPHRCGPDERVRCVRHNPLDVVVVYAPPGKTVQIIFSDRERIVGSPRSDQSVMRGGLPSDPVEVQGDEQTPSATQDANLRMQVLANVLSIQALRPLVDQPLHPMTQLPDGRVTSYTLLIRTAPPRPATQVAATGEEGMRAAVVAQAPDPATDNYKVIFQYPPGWAAPPPPPRVGPSPAERRVQERLDAASTRHAPGPDACGRFILHGSPRARDALRPVLSWTDSGSTYLDYGHRRRPPDVKQVAPDGTLHLAQVTTPREGLLVVPLRAPILVLADGDMAVDLVNLDHREVCGPAAPEPAPLPPRRRQ
jgi:hypothetical protein